MVEKCLLDVDPCEEFGDKLLNMSEIRVLVADSCFVIADATAMILKQSGFSAFPAYTVGQAVKIAGENAIEVAFIDLHIGETNALDAAARILALRPYCRIVIWTFGRGEPVLSWVRREADRLFGGCELICMPIDPLDMIRIARGEASSYEPSEPAEACLSGSQLHQYLSREREAVLKVLSEGQRRLFRGWAPREGQVLFSGRTADLSPGGVNSIL